MNMHLSLIVAMMLSFYTCVCALWANHVEKFTLHLKQWDQCGKRVQDKFMMIQERIARFKDIIRICKSLIEFQLEEWVDWMEEELKTRIKPMKLQDQPWWTLSNSTKAQVQKMKIVNIGKLKTEGWNIINMELDLRRYTAKKEVAATMVMTTWRRWWQRRWRKLGRSFHEVFHDQVQLQGASKTLVHEHTSRGLCTQVMLWSRHNEAAQSSYQAAWTLRILTPRTMASLQRRQVRSLALWL